MTPRERSDLLCRWALEEGFDRAGVARLEPPPTASSPYGKAFLDWLAGGGHAGMGYLARRVEVRLDPRLVLEGGARSAVCVALDYAWPEDADPSGDLWPRVARYARGRDYHDVMGERLRSLAQRVEDGFPGTSTRFYVDTGPVLERELAERAGLGVAGKNTNLLHPEAGSWFLLGELFLDLDLGPSDPMADLCGSCTECLDACPTGAFPEPYRLDSSRCISYWTIEHRGSIPEPVRESLGDWVFGCDVCQEVCPVNLAAPAGGARANAGEKAPQERHAPLQLPEERTGIDLTALLRLDRDAYVEAFRGSPMKRAKLEGLQRNAAVAAGNQGRAGDGGEPRNVTALGEALESASAIVRSHAAWALGRIGGAAARAALEGCLPRESEAEVVAEIEAALRAEGEPSG